VQVAPFGGPWQRLLLALSGTFQPTEGRRNRLAAMAREEQRRQGLRIAYRRVKRFFSQAMTPSFFSLLISEERPVRSTTR
jgi:hypothetical protein